MIKEGLKNVSVITGVILYFYISGALYLIGYWATFNLDITPFISTQDVLKYFVFPFIITNIFSIILLICININVKELKKGLQLQKKRDELNEIDKPKIKTVKKDTPILGLLKYLFLDINFIILFYLFFAVKFYISHKHNPIYWIIVVLIFSFLVLKKLINWLVTLPDETNYYRMRYLIMFGLMFPISCFVTGKILSLNIYNNKEVRTIQALKNNQIQAISDSTKFKILGFIGDKVIISSLNNERIIILNQSTYEGLELGKLENIQQ